MSTSNQQMLIYLKTSDWLFDNGVDETVKLVRRAADIGYNGLVAWDNYHARSQPADIYPEAAQLQSVLSELGWSCYVQCAYTGKSLADYVGDSSMLESNVSGDDSLVCLADNRTFDAWKEQAARLNQWWPGARGVLLSYDEMRGQGTHGACRVYDGRFGDLLASHARQAIALHRAVNPNWTVGVWSDMFDPNENAAPGDYRNVKGGWSGSWNALDEQVLIFNWNTKPDGSDDGVQRAFQFFAGRGNPQVYCGYYDGPDGDGVSASDERDMIDSVKDQRVIGYMYTTWKDDYEALGDYFPAGLAGGD